VRLSRLQKNFEILAADDPLWTVLSDNSKRGGKWDPEEFYQSGEDAIRGLEERLATFSISLRGDTALDFGCGVGRLTFPLSRRFDIAIGVDISRSMIDAAESNSGRGEICRFILNTVNRLTFLESESIDFAYSDIVFQHIAPRYSKKYFLEIARSLKQGGTFVFQLPSHRVQGGGLRKRLQYNLKAIAQVFGYGEAYFEMNAIPRERLVRFIESHTDLSLVTLWDYPVAGSQWKSYLYVFKKQ